jgi:hypothetical protein
MCRLPQTRPLWRNIADIEHTRDSSEHIGIGVSRNAKQKHSASGGRQRCDCSDIARIDIRSNGLVIWR